MGSLLNSLVTVASSMDVTQKAIETAINNVTNAETPGFAKQTLSLLAKRFELDSGLIGGVDSGPLMSSRAEYLERGVWEQSSQEGRYAEQSGDLARLEPVFDVAHNSGIAGAIDNLFKAFSQWSVNPNDMPIRQTVLQSAQDLAHSFNYAASTMGTISRDLETQTSSNIDKINQLGQRIQAYNAEVRTDSRKLQDPGLDAQIHSTLEELSKYVAFGSIRAADGSYAITIGGQASLVSGDHFYPISADSSNLNTIIRDAAGGDITVQVSGGSLKGVLDVHNNFIPGILSSLDTLAQSVADRVNSVLAGGVDKNGSTPTVDLFAYDAAQGAAATLSANPLAPDQLAGALPGAPGGNGNALDLASLASSREINSFTFTQFYGQIGGKVGNALASSREEEQTQSMLVSQARRIREQHSAVSLDEEATNLIAFQRQYEANAELVRVLNSLTETTIGLLG